MPKPATPQQQALPLEPQPPCPQEVQAELVRLWKQRPRWRKRYASVDALLAANEATARALLACARQLLVQRRREWAGLQPRPRTTTR